MWDGLLSVDYVRLSNRVEEGSDLWGLTIKCDFWSDGSKSTVTTGYSVLQRELLDKGVGLFIYFSGADRLLGDLGRQGVVTADPEDLGMATEIT